MNAKEMFEELGYVRSIGEFTIIYIKKFDDGSYHNITFNVLSKVYTTDWYCCNKVFAITVELHKAINQQCKELGWLERTNTLTEHEIQETELGYQCSCCNHFLAFKHKGLCIECVKQIKYCPNCGKPQDRRNVK